MRQRLAAALIALLAAGTLGTAASAQAPHANPARLQAVYDCAALIDGAERLACFDANVGALRTEQEGGQIAVIDREGARSVQREAFGFSLPNLARLMPFRGSAGQIPDAPLSEGFAIARIAPRPDNRAAFTMSNGQVWTMVEAEPYRRVRAGANVTIRRAALGSYFMELESGGAGFRVRREQ